MTQTSETALIIIDIQNDYFDGFAFPQWEAERVLEANIEAAQRAKSVGIPIILVQHVADSAQGLAPFFNEGSEGVAIHPRLLNAIPDARIVRKSFADSFRQTELKAALDEIGAKQLLLAGMMTQNCVTHTALSKDAESYSVSVIGDLCSSVSEMIHLIALNALAPRVAIVESQSAF